MGVLERFRYNFLYCTDGVGRMYDLLVVTFVVSAEAVSMLPAKTQISYCYCQHDP